MPNEQGRPTVDDVDFAEALTAFTLEEQVRLERYIARAERLAGASFWQRREHKINVKMVAGSDVQVEMSHVEGDDDEALDALFARLRQLWSQGRPTAASFPRTIALLREHAQARNSADGQTLLTIIDQLVAAVERAETEETGIGMEAQTRNPDGTVSSRRVTPREAFEDWLYGEFLHDDEERLARIEVFRPHGIHLYVALGVATDLTRVYLWTARQLVQRVLAETSLFSASA